MTLCFCVNLFKLQLSGNSDLGRVLYTPRGPATWCYWVHFVLSCVYCVPTYCVHCTLSTVNFCYVCVEKCQLPSEFCINCYWSQYSLLGKCVSFFVRWFLCLLQFVVKLFFSRVVVLCDCMPLFEIVFCMKLILKL